MPEVHEDGSCSKMLKGVKAVCVNFSQTSAVQSLTSGGIKP